MPTLDAIEAVLGDPLAIDDAYGDHVLQLMQLLKKGQVIERAQASKLAELIEVWLEISSSPAAEECRGEILPMLHKLMGKQKRRGPPATMYHSCYIY